MGDFNVQADNNFAPDLYAPAPKRIIICCDGSGQSAVSGLESIPSNVTRLCRSINPVGIDQNDKKWQQIVWYDSGVGTNSEGQVAVGKDLEGNVIEAYNFCVLNWNHGDQILCFGFSRGAYTARAIAGLISDLGICSKSNLQNFPEVWKLYKQSHPAVTGNQFYGSDAYFDWQNGKPADPQPVGLMAASDNIAWEYPGRGEWAVTPESRQVEVVGVFETVGALGFPEIFGYEVPRFLTRDKPEWHNVGLSPNIKHAFQALALDEHRAAFTPTLFYIPPVKEATDKEINDQEKKLQEAITAYGNTLTSDRPSIQEIKSVIKEKNKAERELMSLQDSLKERTKLLQVWFPGVHINVGGGSDLTLENKGNMEEMSNIAFAWMLDQIKGFVSLSKENLKTEEKIRQDRLSTINDKLHLYQEKLNRQKQESWAKWILRSGQQAASSVLHPFSPAEGVPNYLHERKYTWGLGELPDNFALKYYVNGSRPRTPGRYAIDKTKKKLGETFEEIHPVVGYRVQNTKYRPIGLTGLNYQRRRKEGGGYEYCFKYPGSAEYEIFSESKLSDDLKSHERMAVEGQEARDYVEALSNERRAYAKIVI
ncbi:hypothetical protein N7520_000815 [Penicillium odoratum]|uniref:uncharacterized protein n=1 Tax=Penicillium odoratum TaxID=1167516 RepID=UPI00254691CD|nr:uncharacterized protein N7520_000815 [Penicillium odoratum]KAJ5777569.1 hypothetical protein N7520_000815 [Penicillium odoratum]